MTFGWINAVNAAIVAVLFAASAIGQRRSGLPPMKSRYPALNILEQIGRYACMALMVLPLCPGLKFGFATIGAFLVWAVLTLLLLIVYVLLWADGVKSAASLYALAIVPALLFLESGVYLRHWALLGAAVLFGVSHTLIVHETLRRTKTDAADE
ncbi:MAG: hypothetical protein IJL52_00275 [Clostridia bacterium]|nr:hypothetical protein [Clostridia bacterium]